MSKRKKVSKESEEPEVDDGREDFSVAVSWSQTRIEVEGWRVGLVGVHYRPWGPVATFTHIPTGFAFAFIEAPHGYILRMARIVNADIDLNTEDPREAGIRFRAWAAGLRVAAKMLNMAEVPPALNACIHDKYPMPEPKKRRSRKKKSTSEPAA